MRRTGEQPIALCRLLLLVAGLLAAAGAARPAVAAQAAEPQRRYFTTHFTFNDVDVAKLERRLRRVGLNLPFALSGNVTARIQIGIPPAALGTPRAYRLDGHLQSKALTVSGVELHDLSADLRYRDGTLALESLTFRIASDEPQATAGTFRGRAAVGLIPRGNLTANLTLDNIPLAPLAKQFPDLPPVTGGRMSGRMTASVPATAFRDLSQWTAHGEASVADLELLGMTLETGAVTFTVGDSALTITRITGRIPGATLDGTGTVRLAAPFPFEARATATATDLPRLLNLVGRLPVPVSGTVRLTTDTRGTLDPRQWSATGTGTAQPLTIGPAEIPSARFDYAADAQQLTLSNLNASLYGGQVTGMVRLPFDGQGTATAAVQWQGARLGEAAVALGLPAGIVGTVRGRLDASVPLDRLRDPAAWQVAAQVNIDRAGAGGLALDGAATLRTDQGVLHVPQLVAAWGQTQVQGTAEVTLTAPYRYDATLQLVNVAPGDLNRLPERFRPPLPLAGRFNTHLKINGALQPLTLRGEGSFSATGLGVAGVTLDTLSFFWTADGGQLRVQDIDARLGDARLTGALQVGMQAPYRFDINLTANDAELARFNALPPGWRLPARVGGRVDLTVAGEGTLQPFDFNGKGALDGRNLLVGPLRIDSMQTAWSAAEGMVRLTGLDARLYGGTASGSATVPLDPQKSGEASVTWQDLQAGPITKALIPNLPVEPQAAVNGTARATLGPADADGRRPLSADLTVQAPKIVVGSLTLGSLHLKASDRDGVLSYTMDAALLDGTVMLAGRWNVRNPQAGPDEGELQMRGVQLAPLGQLAGRWPLLRSLSGQVDASARYVHSAADGRPAGEGTFDLMNLRWKNTLLADETRGRIRINGERIAINGLTATWAGGRVRADLLYDVRQPTAGRFTMLVRGAELDRVLALVAPSLRSPVIGRIDLQLRGTLGDRWQGEGQIEIGHSKVGSVIVGSLRVPVTLSYDPATGTAQARLRDAVISVAEGRITGSLQLTWSGLLQVEGDLKFSRLDLQTLLRETIGGSPYGRGRISGELTLKGQNVASVRDLSGKLNATLRDVQPHGMPVVSVLLPYLRPALGGGRLIDEGELKVQFTNGIARVEKLTLSGDALQLYADGTATYPGERLRLNVIANTRLLGTNRFAAQGLLDALPAVGPTPITLLVEADRFVSDRVIYLRVTGTVHRPTVRIEPVPMLEEEALRFFLGAAVGPNVPLP